MFLMPFNDEKEGKCRNRRMDESNLRRRTHSLCKSVHPQIFLGKLQATKLSKARGH